MLNFFRNESGASFGEALLLLAFIAAAALLYMSTRATAGNVWTAIMNCVERLASRL